MHSLRVYVVRKVNFVVLVFLAVRRPLLYTGVIVGHFVLTVLEGGKDAS